MVVVFVTVLRCILGQQVQVEQKSLPVLLEFREFTPVNDLILAISQLTKHEGKEVPGWDA